MRLRKLRDELLQQENGRQLPFFAGKNDMFSVSVFRDFLILQKMVFLSCSEQRNTFPKPTVFETAEEDKLNSRKRCGDSLRHPLHKRETHMGKYQYRDSEREMLEHLQVPFAIYQLLDKRVVTLILSDGFLKLFGYEDRMRAYEDMDHDMYRDTHPDDAARIAEEAIRFATEGGRYDVIYRSKADAEGNYNVIHAVGEHMYTEDGTQLAHISYICEGLYSSGAADGETELNRAMNNALHTTSLVRESRYDYLTGLPNMSYFFELSEAARAEYNREGKAAALLYMNLEGMKYFNRDHSYAEGDRYLQAFGKLLSSFFHNENCSHIGADHFAVFIEDNNLEEQLNSFFAEAGKLNNGDSLPVRVGIYSSRLEDVPVNTACDRAKFACSLAERVYESCYKFYDHNLHNKSSERQKILTDFNCALEEQRIEVYYQPIVRAVNGRVCDEEALSRWIDPVRGMLSPADFIPVLEEAGRIYKLDLYVLDRVLEKLNFQKAGGFSIVPHSINLSRSDFESCDIVEEIRRRVDASGIERRFITIEITESVIGQNFDFMKSQVDRFRSLGFQVWMDDFGSGYSSLDVLHSIRFDLIKFDMSFTRRLNESDDAKIILTELMRMANALGLETVCEGVENEMQSRFLQEIGCSKLQGYLFCRPIPYSEIVERYRRGIQIGYENPLESEYYDAVGKVNLYDLSTVVAGDDREFQHSFNTLPMCILEAKEKDARFVRGNKSFREFMKRTLEINPAEYESVFTMKEADGLYEAVRTACEKGSRVTFDEKMPDGSNVHAIVRRIGSNPATGYHAVAIAILTISEPNEETMTYASIARALAADYYSLYYIDLDTDKFIEYSSPVGEQKLAVERRGEQFFESAKQEAETQMYKKDRAEFFKAFTKESIIRELDQQGVFTLTYRLMADGKPTYVNMKVMRMPGGNHIIMGISIVDTQMKEKEMMEKLQREKDAFTRLMALSENYLSVYSIDPATGKFFEYTATSDYDSLGLNKEGDDFFLQSQRDIKKAICPEDLPLFLETFTMENVMKQVREKGAFILKYRLIINGTELPVTLKIALIQEKEGQRLIAGVSR